MNEIIGSESYDDDALASLVQEWLAEGRSFDYSAAFGTNIILVASRKLAQYSSPVKFLESRVGRGFMERLLSRSHDLSPDTFKKIAETLKVSVVTLYKLTRLEYVMTDKEEISKYLN